jgi:phage portal protein BeeE
MFEWIKEKFTSKSRAADAFYQEAGWTQLGEDRTSDPNFERIAREAFNKNPKVYAALDTIADAVMTSPLKVVNQDGEEVEAPITALRS